MKFFLKLIFLFSLHSFSLLSQAQDAIKPSQQDEMVRIEIPPIVMKNIPVEIKVIADTSIVRSLKDTVITAIAGGKNIELQFKGGTALFRHTFHHKEEVVIQSDEFTAHKTVTPIPLWMSILPPLIAILFALMFREVFSALFIGLLVGTTLIAWYQGSSFIIAIFQGVFMLVDTYILQALFDTDHLSIIIFSMMIGGMVNLITRNGGMKGVVNILSRYATTSRSGQFVTWLMGILIFFDDYANTLVVGNTMRPMTDRLRISREKLAYLVDSTAAPVAAIAFVTTWIGAELSYIQDGIDTLGLNQTPYSVFINSLAYSFYPVFTLVFILFLIARKSDYGPMFKAEQYVRRTGEIRNDSANTFSNNLNELEVAENIRARWFNAVIPVLVIIVGTVSGLLYTGWDSTLWNNPDIGYAHKVSLIIGESDSYKALLWSSLSGVLVALLLTLSQRIMTLKNSIDSLINGFRTMLTAILILVLAWSIALVTEHLHTADFISNTMLEIALSPYLVPALTFILAALVSFSTGSSWGTMAILYPLILPASWLIAKDWGLDHGTCLAIFYNVVSAVLAGSVLGDHCSPISDTTILSSLASSCNHIEHVRTQLPYALTVGVVSIVAGTIPAAYGVPSWILFPAGLVILYLVVRLAGRKTEVFKLEENHYK
ncbi:MAG: Na+/H+ antiporter NhaC family protein [Bacteroidetes bacterium]|nr:Na+/H+ antiporter NhaC family protein [Bacteroidota bacterium]